MLASAFSVHVSATTHVCAQLLMAPRQHHSALAFWNSRLCLRWCRVSSTSEALQQTKGFGPMEQ